MEYNDIKLEDTRIYSVYLGSKKIWDNFTVDVKRPCTKSPEACAVIDRLSTKLSVEEEDAIATFVDGLVSDNVWHLISDCWCFTLNSTDHLTSWINGDISTVSNNTTYDKTTGLTFPTGDDWWLTPKNIDQYINDNTSNQIGFWWSSSSRGDPWTGACTVNRLNGIRVGSTSLIGTTSTVSFNTIAGTKVSSSSPASSDVLVYGRTGNTMWWNRYGTIQSAVTDKEYVSPVAFPYAFNQYTIDGVLINSNSSTTLRFIYFMKDGSTSISNIMRNRINTLLSDLSNGILSKITKAFNNNKTLEFILNLIIDYLQYDTQDFEIDQTIDYLQIKMNAATDPHIKSKIFDMIKLLLDAQ